MSVEPLAADFLATFAVKAELVVLGINAQDDSLIKCAFASPESTALRVSA